MNRPGPGLLALGLVAGSCFSGDFLAGQPCENDEQCAPYSACTNGHCAGCGDLIVQSGEECDEGAQTESCNADCTLPRCGDGVVRAPEACDEGMDSDTCNIDCTLPRCGDGVRRGDEECDPGNNEATADCDPDCTMPICGDGVVNGPAGEVCDPALAAGCPDDCKLDVAQKGLTGKSARVVVTMGMPAVVYRWYFRAHSVKSLERNILGFVGVAPVRETLVGMVDTLDAHAVETWRGRLRQLGVKAS